MTEESLRKAVAKFHHKTRPCASMFTIKKLESLLVRRDCIESIGRFRNSRLATGWQQEFEGQGYMTEAVKRIEKFGIEKL